MPRRVLIAPDVRRAELECAFQSAPRRPVPECEEWGAVPLVWRTVRTDAGFEVQGWTRAALLEMAGAA